MSGVKRGLVTRLVDNIGSVIIYGFLQLFCAQVRPGTRLGLGAGIGPPVAVVEVDQDLETQLFARAAISMVFIQVVVPTAQPVPGIVGRVNPNAQADPVHTVIFEDLQAILLDPIDIILPAAEFDLAQHRDICPHDKVRVEPFNGIYMNSRTILDVLVGSWRSWEG